MGNHQTIWCCLLENFASTFSVSKFSTLSNWYQNHISSCLWKSEVSIPHKVMSKFCSLSLCMRFLFASSRIGNPNPLIPTRPSFIRSISRCQKILLTPEVYRNAPKVLQFDPFLFLIYISPFIHSSKILILEESNLGASKLGHEIP